MEIPDSIFQVVSVIGFRIILFFRNYTAEKRPVQEKQRKKRTATIAVNPHQPMVQRINLVYFILKQNLSLD